jgi:site-specific recombinase XerD
METIQPTTNGPHTRLELIQNRAIPSGQLKTNQLIIKPKQLTIQDIEKLQFGRVQDNNLVLERSIRGFKLKTKVKIPLKDMCEVSSIGLVKYVIASLSKARPKLAPFVFENQSLLKLANYLLRYRTGSLGTLYLYVDCIWHYTQRTGLSPDQLILDVKDEYELPKHYRIPYHIKALEDYTSELQDRGLAPSRISNYIKAIRALYRVNSIDIKLPQSLSRRPVTRDRAPKPEELSRIIDLADLRERVIVSMLALGGFRQGTLVKLKYRHVEEDLEKGITPLHIHVEAAITKGKYHDYDTFIGKEAATYLREYLETRRLGSPDGKIPPETITSDSPLIRSKTNRIVRSIGQKTVYNSVHNLYFKARLLKKSYGSSYTLRVHSIRKYFKTQLLALGVQSDYVDYMMGHTIDVYHDIQMNGIDYLRNIYRSSGLSIRPKAQTSKMGALKEIIRAWGLNPEEILTREALSKPHRTVISPPEYENIELKILCNALKEAMIKGTATNEQ